MANTENNLNWNEIVEKDIDDLVEALGGACDIADDLEEAIFADEKLETTKKAFRLCALVRVLKSHVETNFGYLDQLNIIDKDNVFTKEDTAA